MNSYISLSHCFSKWVTPFSKEVVINHEGHFLLHFEKVDFQEALNISPSPPVDNKPNMFGELCSR